MRTPKRGDAYQICIHFVDDSVTVSRHFLRLPKRQWLVLCTVCHDRYAKRTEVQVEGMLRLFSSAQALRAQAADAPRVAPRKPPKLILVPPGPPQPRSRGELELFMLRSAAQELLASMCLPSEHRAPHELRKRLRSLRLRYHKQQQRLETTGSVGPNAASQLAEVDRALQHMDARVSHHPQGATFR